MLAPSKTPDLTRAEPESYGPEAIVQGVFEPPNSFVLVAIARNKLLILVVVVLCALVGLGLGVTHKHTYTASATLQVGQVNPNSPGFLGYVQSASALATSFSRAIGAEPVLAAVQDKLKISPSEASARLSSEPIPLSPSFVVDATGPTEIAATQLANVAADAVIAYESHSNSANPEAASLLTEFHEAAVQAERATQRVTLALKNKLPTNAKALAEAERTRASLIAERNTVLTRLNAIRTAYTAAVSSQAPRSGLVSLVAGATSATNNRKSKIEVFGFIGLLAGIVLGCIVAILRESRRRSRRPASEAS